MVEERDLFGTLYAIVDGLNRRFPTGNDPFQAVTRLSEEAGELAAAVNHHEGTGVKQQKHGEPDRAALADEVQHVMRAALAIARHYGIEQELADSITQAHARLKRDGYV